MMKALKADLLFILLSEGRPIAVDAIMKREGSNWREMTL